MADPIPREIAGDYVFVNNCFGSFFRGILNWFADDFYPRFNYRVIGSYDKAVEFFNKKKTLGHEVESPLLPSVTLDPAYDFSPEERGGRFLWQTRFLAPGIGVKIFDPIDLREQDVLVTPIFSRYQGTFEFIFWMQSVYELLDFRVMLLQFTGGFNRYIRPQLFWSYIILPDHIKDFENENREKLDWGNTDATFVHIDNMNQVKYVHPILLNPIMKLDSLNDNSTKYGGDQIAEYKLSATFTYEIELPTYMILSNKVDGQAYLTFEMGKTYTKYGLVPPGSTLQQAAIIDQKLIDIFDMEHHRIVPEETDESTLILDAKDAFTNPQREEILNWNPIFNGKLVSVDDSNVDTVEFEKGDILLCSEFRESYLPFLRRSSGAICRAGTSGSLIYRKCKILKKPLLSNILTDYNQVVSYNNSDVTVDPIERKIWAGILNTEQVDSDDPDYGYHILDNLRDVKPDLIKEAQSQAKEKNNIGEHSASATQESVSRILIAGPVNGVENVFDMYITPERPEYVKIYVDDDIQHPNDYTINGSMLIFNNAPKAGSLIYVRGDSFIMKDTILSAIYEFTDTDLQNESDEYIEIILPFEVRRANELLLVSYAGIMHFERDWDLDISSRTLTIKLKPRAEEMVEIFRLME